MTHIRFARRLAPVLAAAIVVAALGCGENTESPTGPHAAPALAAAATTALSFRQVSVGKFHYTCGVTTDNRAYCWGRNWRGVLGDGTTTQRLRPTPVAGGLRFLTVSAGYFHTCAVATDNRAYCWGAGASGRLGNGTPDDHLTPVAVAGGLRFRQVTTANQHTCGVTTDDRAYCWGFNGLGQLGNGTTARRLAPFRVAGGHRFRQVSAGFDHTCAVTTDDRAYCWGNNEFGQVGDGTASFAGPRTPVPVVGGLRFRQVSGGHVHTCGVTLDNRAYCWGDNRDGALGDGTTTPVRLTPVPVVGGLQFGLVRAGLFYACGLTRASVAYCWGNNLSGQLGDGTLDQQHPTPAAVAGGLQFLGISTGQTHTCGVTLANRAYCWGNNAYGKLGDGTMTSHRAPVPVAGPL
jgi:alpha-tubulin suppressor-like RCC1 family protein